MTSTNTPAILRQLGNDVMFLAMHARCPANPRKLLMDWSTCLARGENSALQEAKLADVLDALVTISHANAVFSNAKAPAFYRGNVALEAEDAGGFFAARHAISILIESAPIGNEVRLFLAGQVLARIDADLRKLEDLIPVA